MYYIHRQAYGYNIQFGNPAGSSYYFYIIGCITRQIIEKVMTSNRFIKEVTDETEKVQDGSEDTGDADDGENDVQSQES